MSTPQPTDRYAVVCPGSDGPAVSFWSNHQCVIHLMTYYSNVAWSQPVGFSAWHRRSAKARWVCITN